LVIQRVLGKLFQLQKLSKSQLSLKHTKSFVKKWFNFTFMTKLFRFASI
jgi:hypothetical protein